MDVEERLCPSCGNWVIARLYALPRRAICPTCENKIPDDSPRLQRQVSSLSELGVAQASQTKEQRIAESRRGDGRDKLLAQLLTIGVEADLDKPGRAEERIGAYAASKGAASLGLISIEKSPIQWVNVVKVAARKRRFAKVLAVVEALYGEPLGTEHSPIQTFECLLPDPRLNEATPRVRILTRPPGLLDAAESTRRQLGPWQEESGDYLQSLARAGNLDALIEAGNALLAEGDLVEVRSHPAAGAWSISFQTEAESNFADVVAGLTLERWQAFEALAEVLAGEPESAEG